jgi:hypothetical protein
MKSVFYLLTYHALEPLGNGEAFTEGLLHKSKISLNPLLKGHADSICLTRRSVFSIIP